MAGTRSTNTMTEELQKLLGQIAQMKAAPDADIAYLTSLETQVLSFLRAPFEKQRMEAQLQGPQLQGAGGGPATPGGATPMPAAPGPAEQLLFGTPAPARVPGVMRGASMPSGDELRRLMEQPAL